MVVGLQDVAWFHHIAEALEDAGPVNHKKPPV
jgi:hypothetical protein